MPDTHVDVSTRSGLPCRAGGCEWKIATTPLAQKDKLAFALLCQARIDHERAEHGYVHEQVRVAKAKYDWGPGRRHVLPGQAI